MLRAEDLQAPLPIARRELAIDGRSTCTHTLESLCAGWPSALPVTTLLGVVSSDVWDDDTAAAYETDSADMFRPETIAPAVRLLSDYAGPGPALAFAIGTGRLAIPLARRGIPVTGIDLSPAMVAQLRSKASAEEIPAVIGDMATTVVPGEFTLVFLPWNSLSNLRTQDEQVECFRNAARHLRGGGHFRYAWPSECDLMARMAGMELLARYGDWDRSPFTADSDKHVSIWRKPPAQKR